MLDNNNMDSDKRKPLIFYVLIVSVIILLLNTFVIPMMLARQVQVVGYSDFLAWVDAHTFVPGAVPSKPAKKKHPKPEIDLELFEPDGRLKRRR